MSALKSVMTLVRVSTVALAKSRIMGSAPRDAILEDWVEERIMLRTVYFVGCWEVRREVKARAVLPWPPKMRTDFGILEAWGWGRVAGVDIVGRREFGSMVWVGTSSCPGGGEMWMVGEIRFIYM